MAFIRSSRTKPILILLPASLDLQTRSCFWPLIEREREMAAYASVVSLSQTIQHFLHHEFDHHPLPISIVDLQIESLQEHANFLQAFLDDSNDGKVTTDLEGRIRDASNAAEDTLEYFMLGSEDLQKLSSELQQAAEKIVSIVEKVKDIKNNTARVEFGDSSSSSRLPPTIGKDEIMVGFDDDLLEIKSRLCGYSQRLEIVPICGMGGIGKTTLARNAYENPSTVHRFHIRAWVTVSQDYKAQEVLSRLQISMKAFVGERNGQGDEVVYKSLKGRRYLIVLDDMWSTEVWDDVKRLFPDDNNGSRILLTTRLVDVAAYADSSSNLHQMRVLGEDPSWQLLQQKVFKEDHCPPQLKDIGMAIARRCKGLPLAIVVVAGILSTISPTKASWEEVASKVSFHFNGNDDEITKIFSLSYTNLPHHLRPCFLYMGRFPEDYEIHVSKLVKLWTAEGIMKPQISKCFEAVAEEYLEDLVKRSLVLVMRREPNSRIKSCSIHDLLRDLCIRKAEEEKFLLDGLRPGDHFGFLDMDSIERYVPTVHSVLFFHDYREFYNLKRFRLLRVLDATKSYLKKFPVDVLELYLLRYLAIYIFMDAQVHVPPSISKLQNLQTLLICSNSSYLVRTSMVQFPSEIWSMRRLRHLDVVGIVVVRMPEPSPTPFVLQDLQTLATIRNFRCTERVLQMIHNVKKLGILYDDESGGGGGLISWAEKYHLHNLVHLSHLEKLSITLRRLSAVGIKLWFPTMLKKLKLYGWRPLSKQVMGIIGSLPNLEVLKLQGCTFEGRTWETTEGGFPKLKYLQIIDSDLMEWKTESSHFPSLKHLFLEYCFLHEIPQEIGEIPTLEVIEMTYRNYQSFVDSAIRIKEEQQSYGNDSLEFRFHAKISYSSDDSSDGESS